MKNGTLLATESFLFYLGGSKVTASGRASIDDLMTDTVTVFELNSSAWLRMSNYMPRRLTEFGAIYFKKHLYIIGSVKFFRKKIEIFSKFFENMALYNFQIFSKCFRNFFESACKIFWFLILNRLVEGASTNFFQNVI
jgi:hypothetical protein